MAHALRRDDRVSVDMCCRVVTTLSSGNADHQRLFAELGVCELTCDSIRRSVMSADDKRSVELYLMNATL